MKGSTAVAMFGVLVVSMVVLAITDAAPYGAHRYSLHLPHEPVNTEVLLEEQVKVHMRQQAEMAVAARSKASAGAHAEAKTSTKAESKALAKTATQWNDDHIMQRDHEPNHLRPRGVSDYDAHMRAEFAFPENIEFNFEGWSLYLFDDFEDHAFPHWSNPHITTCGATTLIGGYATVNGPQGETWSHVTELPVHSHVRIKANVFFVDNWENEFFYMKIDDRVVYTATCTHCGRKGRNFCGNIRYCDTLSHSIDVTVPHKNDLVRFTFGSSSAKHTFTMSYGVTNLQLYLKDECGGKPSVDNDSSRYKGNQKFGKMADQPTCQQLHNPFTEFIPRGIASQGPCMTRDWPGLHCKWCRDMGNIEDGTYWISPHGPHHEAYLAYCDMQVDEGGWTLFVGYNHHTGDDTRKVNKVPQDPWDYNGNGHKSLKEMGFALDEWTELRFFCKTSNHGRQIHFKTINEDILRTAWEWDQTLFTADDWKSGWEPLPGHAGHLPAATNSAYREKFGGFFEFPFYAEGAYHWGIRGGGNRWECDDTSYLAGQTNHQIYAKGF